MLPTLALKFQGGARWLVYLCVISVCLGLCWVVWVFTHLLVYLRHCVSCCDAEVPLGLFAVCVCVCVCVGGRSQTLWSEGGKCQIALSLQCLCLLLSPFIPLSAERRCVWWHLTRKKPLAPTAVHTNKVFPGEFLSVYPLCLNPWGPTPSIFPVAKIRKRQRKKLSRSCQRCQAKGRREHRMSQVRREDSRAWQT